MKEILRLREVPAEAEEILSQVFSRERERFIQKQRALQDLRERLASDTSERIAYAVPEIEAAVKKLEPLGWKGQSISYITFEQHFERLNSSCLWVGDLVMQSGRYALSWDDCGKDENCEDCDLPKEEYQSLQQFGKVMNSLWPKFDLHPPQCQAAADLFLNFAPQELIIVWEFSKNKKNFQLILPYQVFLALSRRSLS